jgi:predicted site-specific integrase-resolvase
MHYAKVQIMVSQRQASIILDVAPNSLYRWMRRGKITPPTRYGIQMMYNLEQLMREVRRYNLQCGPRAGFLL